MKILAIDPGHEHSAFVMYNVAARRLVKFGKLDNNDLLNLMEYPTVTQSGLDDCGHLVIEQVACMGMAVGAEVFETVFWSGRFAQAWEERGGTWSRLKRHEVKMNLCGNMRAKDGNIRQALIDRFGDGRGKDVAIGKKKTPGPLFGVAADVWSALAVALTWGDRHNPAAPPALYPMLPAVARDGMYREAVASVRIDKGDVRSWCGPTKEGKTE